MNDIQDMWSEYVKLRSKNTGISTFADEMQNTVVAWRQGMLTDDQFIRLCGKLLVAVNRRRKSPTNRRRQNA